MTITSTAIAHVICNRVGNKLTFVECYRIAEDILYRMTDHIELSKDERRLIKAALSARNCIRVHPLSVFAEEMNTLADACDAVYLQRTDRYSK